MTTELQVHLDEIAAFVISLTTRPRNSELIGQLKNQGIDATLWEAVDGRTWTTPFDSALVNVNRFKKIIGRMPTGPEIGCALSHLRCVTRAKEMGSKYALIFEEDAILTSNLLPSLIMMEKLDNGHPIILQLYSPAGSVLRRSSFLTTKDKPNQFFGQFYLPPQHTVAYLINRAAIDIFGSRHIVEGVADWPPFANQIEFWGVFPCPVTHETHGSTIEPQRAIKTGKSKFRHRYLQIIETYFELFRPSRVYEHSQSLGGLQNYFTKVIIPHTTYRIRYLRSKKYTAGDNVVTIR